MAKEDEREGLSVLWRTWREGLSVLWEDLERHVRDLRCAERVRQRKYERRRAMRENIFLYHGVDAPRIRDVQRAKRD